MAYAKRIVIPSFFLVLGVFAFSCGETPSNGLAPLPTSGSGDIPDDGYFTAKELFDRDVYPIFSTRCTPCHSLGYNDAPQWMGVDASNSYARIEAYPKLMIAYPENSWFLLKGEHTGPALEAYEQILVSDWLLAEIKEREFVGEEYYAPEGEGGAGGGGSGTGPVTLYEALEQFGNCMTWEDWQATGMVNLPDQPTEFGACKTCHFAGMGGNYLSGDAQVTFDKNRLFPFVLKIAVGTVDEQGAFLDLVAARRHIDKGIESQNCNQDPCHPIFTLSPAMEAAVDDFFMFTYARWKQGTCSP
ncbi:MAG: hypothetical protein IPM54_06490 [Polyangiaceae bacterium]|nr:hypothetical protein [Polyangiaceae bacterium]